MKTLATIAVISLSAISFSAYSQAGDKKEKELDAKQESERARSTQGIRTDNELKDDRQEVQSNEYRRSKTDTSDSTNQNETQDEVIEPNTDQGLGSDDDGNNLTNENNTTQDGEQRNNAPAVIQRTSSESGSPAVLSGNNGRERDGTNNVQRATPNIAGAKEPGNMNLSEKNDAPRNRNTGTENKIRKQEEQPARIGDDRKTDETNAAPVRQDQESGELKQNTTLEQEPEKVMTAKEERQAKRKNRRNRRKD